MPGTGAEGNCPGCENCSSWDPRGMKSIGRPRPGYENLFNNSSMRSLSAKTAGQFFKGYETCQARYEECSFQDMYNYAYILKYFC